MNAFWACARRRAEELGVDPDVFLAGACYSVGGGILSMVEKMTGKPLNLEHVQWAAESVRDEPVDWGIGLN